MVKLILAEAVREGTELSHVERQMLRYSARTESSFSTLNATFEDESNEVEYEETVSSLIRHLTLRDDTDQATWHEAVALLGEDDYYLSVMIEMAKATRPLAPLQDPSSLGSDRLYDRFKLLATASTIVFLIMILIILFSRK